MIFLISYEPFWKTLKNKGISQYALVNKNEISGETISRLKKNKHIGTATIEKLCKILGCNVQDILTYISDEEEEK